MGSSGTRKPADKLRISLPPDSGSGSGGAGGGGGIPQQDINNICPLTLRVKLVRQDTPVGIDLALDGNALQLAADRSVDVGTVPSSIMKTLQTCMGLGVSYPTISVVENKQGVRYAEFSQ